MNRADKLWELEQLKHKREIIGRRIHTLDTQEDVEGRYDKELWWSLFEEESEITTQISKLLEDE